MTSIGPAYHRLYSVLTLGCLFSVILQLAPNAFGQARCGTLFISKTNELESTAQQREYENEFIQRYSLASKTEWERELTTELAWARADHSEGAAKLAMLKRLGFRIEATKVVAPTYTDFVQNYLRINGIEDPQNSNFPLPAVVMRKAREGGNPEDYRLITPGVDPWPLETGYKILSANQLFNIPYATALKGAKNMRFPLMEASHDIYHFISFSMHPDFARLVFGKLRSLASKTDTSFSRRMFYVLEQLSLANPNMREELRQFLKFPKLKDDNTHRPFVDYAKYFESLSDVMLLEHARKLIADYSRFLIDYGSGAVRSYEKARLLDQGLSGAERETWHATARSEPTHLTQTLIHFASNRRNSLESISSDALALHPLILSNLLELRDSGPKTVLAVALRNNNAALFFLNDPKDFDSGLRPDYVSQIDRLIALQVARMEYAAWESANRFTMERFVSESLQIRLNSIGPLSEFLRDSFGEISIIYRSFIPTALKSYSPN